jgi:endonuclease/exonuclease/phosphatase family metal-dependent hydrolase
LPSLLYRLYVHRHLQGDADKPAVILGDLNTLSPDDVISAEDALRLLTDPRTRRKFYEEPFNGPNEFGFEPFRIFQRTGFYDLGTTNDYTVPTPVNTDAMHAARLRLDFILGNEKAHSALISNAVALKDQTTSALSDHFPIFVSFDRKRISIDSGHESDPKVEL